MYSHCRKLSITALLLLFFFLHEQIHHDTCAFMSLYDTARTFILQSPPGQLQEVLRSLHTLCGGPDEFFEVIPELCLEYTLRHQLCFSFEPHSSGAVLCSKFNQFPSCVKRVAKQSQASGDDVAADFLRYFESTTCEFGEGDFEKLDCVFLDYVRGWYVEVDPVEGRVLRGKRFAGGGCDSSWIVAVETPALDDSVFPEGFMRCLSKEIAKYVDSCFGAEALGHLSVMMTAQAPRRGRTARVVSASSVVAASAASVTIAVSCERFAPAGRWAARWKTVYVLSAAPDGDLQLIGEGRIDGHYFDESNVHVNVEDAMQQPRQVAKAGSAKQLAQAVAAAVHDIEAALQQKLERSCNEIGEAALKGLRRRLPVTKQPFDFQKALLLLPPLDLS